MNLSKSEILMLLRMPHGIRATYLLWRLGISSKYITSAETYSRHRRYLLDKLGIDITKDSGQ